MAKLRLVAYGIAKDIIGVRSMDFEVEGLNDVASLKKDLIKRFPDFEKLAKFSLAVNDEYQDDSFKISEGSEVVIIPPVSGG